MKGVKVVLPAPETVDVAGELAALRALLAEMRVPDAGKLDRALQDAEEEAAKPQPDKDEVGGALERVIKYAKAADDFSGHAEKLQQRIAPLVSWLGANWHRIAIAVGIAV
ncbi:hypothetical protein D1F64_21420 [Breoghania sp. L-A4]|nr:hypothetical protein D1F64_21420 [Breoghania sp. L-A4]